MKRIVIALVCGLAFVCGLAVPRPQLAAGGSRRLPAATSVADPSAAHLFGMPGGVGGGCRRGFARTPELGRLCYRSCAADHDCPHNATCRRVPAEGGARFCYVQ